MAVRPLVDRAPSRSGESGAGPRPRAGLRRPPAAQAALVNAAAFFVAPGKVGVESAMTNTKTTPDLLPVLDELKAGIDLFVSGLELPKPDPEPAAVETPMPAAEAA